MPTSAPLPPPREPHAGSIRLRFLRIMRWGAALSAAIAALAVALVSQGDSEIHWHMMIATALGTGLTMMMGIALMSLIFLSNRSGHDASVAHLHDKDQDDQRP